MNFIRPKIRRERSFTERSGIKYALQQLRRELRTYVRASWVGGQRQRSRRGRGCRAESIVEYFRRRCGHVGIDVVERRIIQQAIAATNDRLAVTGKHASPLRRIGEADAGSDATCFCREGRESPDR